LKIIDRHPLDIDIPNFASIQADLSNDITLVNGLIVEGIVLCAGVDVAYWKVNGIEYGVCCIVVINYETKVVVEKVYSTGKITTPYVPGYLAFRELPLVIKAARKITKIPDLFIFDGNGYLHPRHMGIATHASFFLDTPTIGVAKSYFKVHGANFKMPENETGSYENITVKHEIYGRVLRSHKNVKPIFISCGNYIDLHTTTDVILSLINDESRVPIPVRLADLETKRMRRDIISGN